MQIAADEPVPPDLFKLAINQIFVEVRFVYYLIYLF